MEEGEVEVAEAGEGVVVVEGVDAEGEEVVQEGGEVVTTEDQEAVDDHMAATTVAPQSMVDEVDIVMTHAEIHAVTHAVATQIPTETHTLELIAAVHQSDAGIKRDDLIFSFLCSVMNLRVQRDQSWMACCKSIIIIKASAEINFLMEAKDENV